MAMVWAALLLFVTLTHVQVGPARNENRGGGQAAASDECPGPVYGTRDVEVKPIIHSKPNPRYTEEARRNRVSGRVELAVVLCGTGKVGNIEVIQGLPYGLSEEAVKVARRIKFEPARKDDEPVSVRMRLLYNFEVF